MLKSMTGFGRSILQEDDWSQDWEIRSVNGRHLDTKWRLPNGARSLESQFERVVREVASRGRVNVSLNLQIARPELLGMQLNTVMAETMLRQMGRFAESRGDAFTPDYTRMLGMGFLWDDNSGEPAQELAEGLERGLRAALEDWDEARVQEGKALKKDLAERLIRLEKWLAQLGERTPQVKEERFEAVQVRIQQTLDRYAIDLDQDRLLQEIAVLSDKLDVSEELTRLAAHLTALAQVLQEGADAGKRLDFLLQECFREINTCGNKAQDTTVSRIVVDFKAELEKCREQVQNIE